MSKPKPNEEMVKVNFTIPTSLKGEWKDFAKNVLKCPMAQMIKNAVRDYRLNFQALNETKLSPELGMISQKQEKMMEEMKEKLQQIEQLVQKPKSVIPDLDGIEAIKESILLDLEERNGKPIETKKLAKIIRVDKDETLNILGEMQEKQGLIKRISKGWILQ
jgi:hypothetical protein